VWRLLLLVHLSRVPRLTHAQLPVRCNTRPPLHSTCSPLALFPSCCCCVDDSLRLSAARSLGQSNVSRTSTTQSEQSRQQARRKRPTDREMQRAPSMDSSPLLWRKASVPSLVTRHLCTSSVRFGRVRLVTLSANLGHSRPDGVVGHRGLRPVRTGLQPPGLDAAGLRQTARSARRHGDLLVAHQTVAEPLQHLHFLLHLHHRLVHRRQLDRGPAHLSLVELGRSL
jgi:hypothetical protein